MNVTCQHILLLTDVLQLTAADGVSITLIGMYRLSVGICYQAARGFGKYQMLGSFRAANSTNTCTEFRWIDCVI